MKLNELISFRKDLYFEGAVQADWFYKPEKSSKVAENFVFHGHQYYGIDDSISKSKKRIDTISLVRELLEKLNDDHSNSLSLAIADYGTGKSHLAVTLGHIFSGASYMPDTYNKILNNISTIDKDSAEKINSLSQDKNFVMIINGMRDFNLHSELLKSAQRSLKLYNVSDDFLLKINRSLETAHNFFVRNGEKLISSFEKYAQEQGWIETGNELLLKINNTLLSSESAFDIINKVYQEINGQEIRWDEGLSATTIIDSLISNLCGMSGKFDHIIILFDEFGRYLEYASGVNAAKSGDSALQQIFEASQNAEGVLHVINFIQSDIKTYLQRVDQTKNISRYIGRYDASDKYYISSNLETVFANLIQRVDIEKFDESIVGWQKQNEENWKDLFEKLNRWVLTKGVWKNYNLFRKVIVEGIYPMHPISTLVLTQLSDYLQNRSSLTLISQYIEKYGDISINLNSPFVILPSELMNGDLYIEMLSAEQEGKQPSQQCIKFDNILRNFGDKLSEKSLMVLRCNLIIRILRFKTTSYEDAIDALAICSGLKVEEIKAELNLLENEYAVLGFDQHACVFDFMEESNGAHDYKILKKRLLSQVKISADYLETPKVQELAGINELINTNFSITHKISTNEWMFKQELYPIENFSKEKAYSYLEEWKKSTTSTEQKGKLLWLYINKDTDVSKIDAAKKIISCFSDKPIKTFILNDKDNRLFEQLTEYYVLDNLDESDRRKYDRHYNEDLLQIESNIKDKIEELKREKLQINSDGFSTIATRMPIYLTNVFESIYPLVVPFCFDAFVTKNNNVGGKGSIYYCSIIKMLLSSSVSYDSIHNFSIDIRNRIESLLMTSTETSWKCINDEYRIIPPEEKRAKFVYDEIVNNINSNHEMDCSAIFEKYNLPPYGLSDDIIVLMIAVICSNLSYCLRLKIDNKIIAINNWKELVLIKDKKIDIDLIKKSTFVYVDSDAVSTKYIKFFERIRNNKSLSEVNNLSNRLEEMMLQDEIPETLNTAYLLAKKTLDIGKKAWNEWSEQLDNISDEFYKAKEKDDVYCAINALKKIKDIPILRIFNDNNLVFNQDDKEKLMQKKEEIISFLNDIIFIYVDNMKCKSVEGVNTFRNHHTKMEEMLIEVGLPRYASLIKNKKEAILLDVDMIRRYQSLSTDYFKYLIDSNNATNTTYDNIKNMIKNGEIINNSIEQFSKQLGKDYDEWHTNISNRLLELTSAKKKIDNEISSIWDSLFDAESIDDILEINKNISIVCRSGINKKDYEDLDEVKKALDILLDDLNKLKEISSDRNDFNEYCDNLIKKYDDSEFDFDVISIIDNINEKQQEIFNNNERIWKNKYLNVSNLTRPELLQWIDKTRVLPGYLSKDTKENYNKVKLAVDKKLSDGKIEDVIHCFRKLEYSEKKRCIAELQNILNE